MSDAILSARQVREVKLSPRTYHLAPLSYLQRASYRQELARRGYRYPMPHEVFEAQRQALEEAVDPGPERDELIQFIDVTETAQKRLLDAVQRAQETGDASLTEEAIAQTQEAVQAARRLSPLETILRRVPVYANLLEAMERYLAETPFLLLRFVMRGWSGPDLPAFALNAGGTVDEDLMNQLPVEDLEMLGQEARQLLQPGAAARKNSEAPSPSRKIRRATKATTKPKTKAATSSSGKRSKGTPAATPRRRSST